MCVYESVGGNTTCVALLIHLYVHVHVHVGCANGETTHRVVRVYTYMYIGSVHVVTPAEQIHAG